MGICDDGAYDAWFRADFSPLFRETYLLERVLGLLSVFSVIKNLSHSNFDNSYPFFFRPYNPLSKALQ